MLLVVNGKFEDIERFLSVMDFDVVKKVEEKVSVVVFDYVGLVVNIG